MAAPSTGSSVTGTDPAPPSLIIINRMAAERSVRPEAEQILLVAERRLFLKRRWRGRAADGTEFGFDLADRLLHGCVIHTTDAADYVIRQEPEPVYRIDVSTPEQAALTGWKIGNLHLPVQIIPGAVLTPPDPAARQLFEREGWPWQELTVIFNPLRVTAHAS